jgi:SSS family solute:Na+ symporter
MGTINWLIVLGYLTYVVVDGVRRAKGTKEIDGFFLANRSLSAVTMIGTTGQGATDGIRFVQFYFGLPIAMVILGVTLVPFLHGAKVFTAYEYLERRFDAKTRSLTAFLFLILRSLSCGTIIAAPAVVFSAIFHWSLPVSVAIIGVPTVIYTMIGGVQAVTWADVKQMVIIVGALVAVVVVLLVKMPVHPGAALHIAGATGRLKAFDFRFTLKEDYTFWSGIIGGTFLMLSYFGTDQSQVQRYLTARSVDEARSSLLMSAYWKIPLQALVLLVGVLVFVFYQFKAPPLLYNPAQEAQVEAARGPQYHALQQRYAQAFAAREAAARTLADAEGPRAKSEAKAVFLDREADVDTIRSDALAMVTQVTGDASKDVNYIMPRFVIDQLPVGLSGIFIAAVMAAAMSSIAAELNSLSTTSVIDLYRRWIRPEASDKHFLTVGKIATAFWGLLACFVATYAARLGSLIEVVNLFGSFFYGSILGVFLLAMIKRARPVGAFFGLIAGMASVAAVAYFEPGVTFLWYNVIGALVVVGVGMALSAFSGKPAAAHG